MSKDYKKVRTLACLGKGHSGWIGENSQCKSTKAEGHRPAMRPGWLWGVRVRVAGEEVRTVRGVERVIFGLVSHCSDLRF